MLDHLHIENYRLFKSLKLDGLRRVNLITGRNNTGKTAILETIRILESKADLSVVNDILKKRDAFDSNSRPKEILQSLLNRDSTFFEINALAIENDNGNLAQLDEYITYEDFKHGETIIQKKTLGAIGLNSNGIYDKAVFVPTSFEFDNTHLWKKTDLSPRKKTVIQILHIIEKKIIDIGLDVESRKPRVLLSDAENPIPLKMLGEGTNRIFTIALALVNAKDNILLIDEIDLGLHHSVQEKLWEIVFKFSKELNVQVFATTHSRDCVNAFAEVWNKDENQETGNYIRLQRNRLDTSVIEPVYYDAELLHGSIYDNLETR